MIDYFSTTIDGVGKVVGVDREFVAAAICNDEFVKSLGTEILKYVDDAYVVINEDEDIGMGDILYHIVHICVSEKIGMENVYKIRDTIDDENCLVASIERHTTVSPVASDIGVAYSIHLSNGGRAI